MSAELTQEERDSGVVDLVVHHAMWDWLVEAIEQRGFGVSPPVKTEGEATFRFITIPPERIRQAEQALGMK